MEVEDLCDSARPDERSVMTYIASYFHAFSTMGETNEYYAETTLTYFVIDQATTVSRRVDKFAELMQSVWLIKNDYERRVRLVHEIFSYFCSILITYFQLLAALSSIQSQWSAQVFTGTYTDAKDQSAEFTTYKQTTKRTWVAEKQDVATLFGNVQTKLRTYGLREYHPPPGLALSDLDTAWKMLLEKEAGRSRKINAQIRQ